MVRLVHLMMTTMILDAIASGKLMTRITKTPLKTKEVQRDVQPATTRNHRSVPRLRRYRSNWQLSPDQVLFLPKDYLDQLKQKPHSEKPDSSLGTVSNALAEIDNSLRPPSNPKRPKVRVRNNHYNRIDDRNTGNATISRAQRQPYPVQEPPANWQGYGIANPRSVQTANPLVQKPLGDALYSIVGKMTPEAQNALMDALLKTVSSKRVLKSDSRATVQTLKNGPTGQINVDDLTAAFDKRIGVQKSRNSCRRDHCINRNPPRKPYGGCRQVPYRQYSQGHRCNQPTRRRCNSPPQRGCKHQPSFGNDLLNSCSNDRESKVVNLTQIYNVRPRLLVVNSNLPSAVDLSHIGRYNLKSAPVSFVERPKIAYPNTGQAGDYAQSNGKEIPAPDGWKIK